MAAPDSPDSSLPDASNPAPTASPAGSTPAHEDKGIAPSENASLSVASNGQAVPTPPAPPITPARTPPVRVPLKPPPSNDPISRFRNKQAEDDEARMGFIEHLLELRKRLWVSIIAIAICVVVAFIFYKRVYHFLLEPIRLIDLKYVGILTEKGFPPVDGHVIHITTTQPLGTMMMVIWLGFWAGLVVAFPIVIYELWAFIAPGLHVQEKNAIKPVLYGGVFFFLAGAATAYYVLAPVTFDYFLWLDLDLGVTPNWTSETCIEMLITMMIVSGMLCEIPLLVAGLARLGVLEPKWLIRYWKVLTFGSVLLGMVVSPGNDLFSMGAFAGLILGIYLISIVMAFIFWKKPTDPNAKPAASPTPKENIKKS